MIGRTIALLALLAGNWLVWVPRTLPVYDIARLGDELRPAFAMHDARFPDNPLLPRDYLLLLADDGSPLLSIYAGYYPVQGLSAAGPHDPQVCYATQGWEISPPATLDLEVDGRPATVLTARIRRPEGAMTVIWWAQGPAGLPVAPEQERALDELLRRWRDGRSDKMWLRQEWDVQALEPEHLGEVKEAIATTMRAVQRGFR